MKVFLVVGWTLTLLAAYGLGRSSSPDIAPSVAPSAPSGALPSLSDALDEADFLVRRYQITKHFQGLSPENLDETVALLEKQRSQVTADDMRWFLFAWSRFDPTAAFAWASAGKQRWAMRLEDAAMYAWAYQDAEGALSTFKKLDQRRQNSLRQELITGWIDGGDEGVTAFIYSQPLNLMRTAGTKLLMTDALKKGGPDSLKDWVTNVPQEYRASAFIRAGGFLVDTDPVEAAEWYEAVQEEEWAGEMLNNIARTWAMKKVDLAPLFTWLAQLPANERRNEAIRLSFTTWQKRDPGEAVAWLTSAERDPAFDPAIAIYALRLSRSDHAAAVDWADRIENQNLRKKSLLPILRTWYKKEPGAARDWLNTNEEDLPEELRELILMRPGKQT